MMAAQAMTHLIDQLPAVRGRLEADMPLADLTWFGVGGPAEVLFRPADEDDLIAFLQQRPKHVPITLIGVGSNLLVRDGGVPGIVIRLGRGFAWVKVEGDRLRVGAGTADARVAKEARDAGLSGMEFLRGVPGSMGGALPMNAGAYGSEVSDILVEAGAIDLDGNRHVMAAADFNYGYRHADVPDGWIFTWALLQGSPSSKEQIGARMDEIADVRADSQPVKTRTGGSTFKNPDGQKAWQLIDAAGCRGLRRGGAQVSEVHCNFLINAGGATAADLEALGEEVRRRVKENSGVDLEWEIRRIGIPAGGAA